MVIQITRSPEAMRMDVRGSGCSIECVAAARGRASVRAEAVQGAQGRRRRA